LEARPLRSVGHAVCHCDPLHRPRKRDRDAIRARHDDRVIREQPRATQDSETVGCWTFVRMAGSTILGPIGPDATSNCLKGLAQATGSNFCGATQSEMWDRYAEKLAGLQFFASRYLGRLGRENGNSLPSIGFPGRGAQIPRWRGRLLWLLAPHPLQIRAGRNQLQPLLVAMTDRELLHAFRSNSTSGASAHAV
jgi:hypothetical protein